MICKKCGKELGENETFCKFCGAAVNEGKKTFKLNIQDEEFLAQNDLPAADEEAYGGSNNDVKKTMLRTPQMNLKQTDRYDSQPSNSQARESQFSPADEMAEQTSHDSVGLKEKADYEAAKRENNSYIPHESRISRTEFHNFTGSVGKTHENDVYEQKSEPKRPAVSRTVSAGRKDGERAVKADRTIKIIVCVCAVIIAALTVVSFKTDIFKNTGDKTVALSKLTDEQIVSFENYASKLSLFYETGYDSGKVVLDDIMPLMNPTSENGLYASFYEKKSSVSGSSDPAQRFISSTGTGGYSAVDAQEISEIAQSVGLDSHDDINTVDYYYYDGKYYFKDNESEEQTESSILKVTDSKRTSDGDFYVTCDVYDESAQTNENGDYVSPAQSQLYFIVKPDGESENVMWTLKRISDEPLFSQTGEKITEESTGDSLSYEMQEESFTAKTSEGKVYANYIIEYPLFENNGTTALTINSIYEEIIGEFEERIDTQEVDKLYSEFIENGGNDELLPLYTHVIASVKYNENGYISILERRTHYAGEENGEKQTDETTETTSYYQSATETTQAVEENEEVVFPSTTYEGYTFEIETGEFVKRDSLTGKDYVTIQDNLFSAWLSAGGRLFSADEEVYGQLQTVTGYNGEVVNSGDQNAIGKAIYESSWIMLSDSIVFMFQHADGALDMVTIPCGEPDEGNLMSEDTTVTGETSTSQSFY